LEQIRHNLNILMRSEIEINKLNQSITDMVDPNQRIGKKEYRYAQFKSDLDIVTNTVSTK
jgi:hypothetical protein